MVRAEKEIHLTGRTRVRKGWFGKVILQVEVMTVHYRRTIMDSPGPGKPDVDKKTELGAFPSWRDAHVDDLLQNKITVQNLSNLAM